jgi:hypothetical protein
MMDSALAITTAAGYDSGMNCYIEFCDVYGFSVFEQTDYQMTSFGIFCWKVRGNCTSTIKKKLYAVRDHWLKDTEHAGRWKPFMDSTLFPQLSRFFLGLDKNTFRATPMRERAPIPDEEIAKLHDVFPKVASSLAAGLSCWLVAIIMYLDARRPGEFLSEYVRRTYLPGPCLAQVSFLPAGSAPRLCSITVFHLKEVKNHKTGPRYDIPVPNIPGLFSVGDAFAELYGPTADEAWCRAHGEWPLLPDSDRGPMSYKNFALTLDRAGEEIGVAPPLLPQDIMRDKSRTTGTLGSRDEAGRRLEIERLSRL